MFLGIEALRALFEDQCLKPHSPDYNETCLWYVYVSELHLCRPFRTLMSQVKPGYITYILSMASMTRPTRPLKHYHQIAHSLVGLVSLVINIS